MTTLIVTTPRGRTPYTRYYRIIAKLMLHGYRMIRYTGSVDGFEIELQR